VWPVKQSEQQVFPHARREQVSRWPDIADALTGDTKRQAVDVRVANQQSAARWRNKPGKELWNEVSAAVALTDDRHIGADRKFEVERLEVMDAVAVHDAQIGGTNRALERLDDLGLFEQQTFVEHIRNGELLDDLLVFDRHVLLVLIEVEQFLPRG
jgi:hypothetical protein